MNNTHQRQFSLTVPRLEGESGRVHGYRVDEINGKFPQHQKPTGQKLLSDLLKKQARAVMSDITECPSPALPAHITRLKDLREIIETAMTGGLVPIEETQLSSKALQYASTLADLLACLELTRQSHRAPAFVNQRDQDLEKIHHALCLIAGELAHQKGIPVPEFFTNGDGENER
jgi:hypothetical protein